LDNLSSYLTKREKKMNRKWVFRGKGNDKREMRCVLRLKPIFLLQRVNLVAQVRMKRKHLFSGKRATKGTLIDSSLGIAFQMVEKWHGLGRTTSAVGRSVWARETLRRPWGRRRTTKHPAIRRYGNKDAVQCTFKIISLAFVHLSSLTAHLSSPQVNFAPEFGDGDLLQLTAQDLLGKSHDQLVLLLIHLRRQSAGLAEAIEAARLDLQAAVEGEEQASRENGRALLSNLQVRHRWGVTCSI
jgi:hypothetical protein